MGLRRRYFFTGLGLSMLPDTSSARAADFVTRYGGRTRKYKKQLPVYAQGDRADELLYILSGTVLVTIVTPCGKEALVAILLPGDFFGEDCIDEPALRTSTVTTATDCEVAVLRAKDVLRAFSDDLNFTKRFAAFLMQRNKQLRLALVDQMLLSSEKRLARLLLRLARSQKEVEPDMMVILSNQDMIARMVGTTRSRVNEFMNKFRKLGHIQYSHDRLKVHSSLNSILTNGES